MKRCSLTCASGLAGMDIRRRLGIALVEALARLHGGPFKLADNASGLVARMLLPR